MFLFGLAFGLSFLFILAWRPLAQKKLLDIPNNRSSHQIPTPRGGGLGILIGFAMTLFLLRTHLDWQLWLGLFLVAGIGFLDDFFNGVSSLLRLCIHILAAALAVWHYPLADLAPLVAGSFPQVLGFGLAGFWVVCSINLTNFMDGIDGLAGAQAWFWAWVLVLSQVTAPGLALGGALLGFLAWNWHPAKIFMGDVGSGSLGFLFAALCLRAPAPSTTLLSLVAVGFLFFGDAVWTLLQRIARKEKFWLAHREHLYQKWVQQGSSHQTVSAFYGAISLLVLVLLYFNVLPLNLMGFFCLALFFMAYAVWIQKRSKA